MAKNTSTLPDAPSEADIRKALKEIERRRKYRKIEFFEPYEKQQAFFDLGATMRERLLMAGNQVGKSYAGGFEAAVHMTGLYPDWWKGRRWDRPVRAWFAGETSMVARDIQQKMLCGEPGVEIDFGSGMIPKELFVEKPSKARGIDEFYDTIQVKHKSGGVSVGRFKSYEQGRTKFQGESLDLLWLDEEPDADIYSEALTRTTATGGMVFMTFTPLKGMSEVVQRFLNEHSPDRAVVSMTIDDAKHIPEAERAKIIAGYREHEREARAMGVPMLGSGRIFPYPEASIKCEPFQIPPYWPLIWGTDIGGSEHPFGGALCAWDRDADVFYLTNTVRMMGRPIDHAAAMKPLGTGIPVAWPHDAHIKERGSGEPVAQLYKSHGLKMLPSHATWPDGSMSTEAGITELQERMTTNRFKVFSNLTDWFEEYRQYHRDKGLIVKIRDDLISATRIALMMKRFARTKIALAQQTGGMGVRTIAKGADHDHWGISP